MAKYDSQLGNLKDQLQSAKNVLVVLPAQLTVDKLAASLSLMLALKQTGKAVEIATEGTPLVSHSYLFGIGEVKKELPRFEGGNFIISLDGVVDNSTGTPSVPALEKLDWYPEGTSLNLVFHVVPGQKFEPINIAPKYQANGFEVVFVIGANNPSELGQMYIQNAQTFSNATIVNIDNSQANSGFGKINVIDTQAAAISEIIPQIISGLGLSWDQDIATNVIAGIYDATQNLIAKATPDTFMTISQAMQVGGKLPQQLSQPVVTPEVINQPVAQPPVEQSPAGFDLSKVFQIPGSGQKEAAPEQPQTQIKSQQEAPVGEAAVTTSAEAVEGNNTTPENVNPAPDWLTPKIYKGGSLG